MSGISRHARCNSPAFRCPPRLRSFDYTGKHTYFVTCGVIDRRRAFTDEASVDCVRSWILRTCGEKSFEEIASVYMPDHAHLLLRGTTSTSEFIPFMKLMRQRTAMHYRRLKGEMLWQDGYFDRVLRADDDLTAIVDYMRDNPVRAALPGRRRRTIRTAAQATARRGTKVPRSAVAHRASRAFRATGPTRGPRIRLRRTQTIGVSPAPAEGRSGRSSRMMSIGGTSLNRGTRYCAIVPLTI